MALLSKLFPRRVGWIPNPPDSRDHDFFSMGIQSSPVLNELVSVERWMPPVHDQGTMNTCVWECIQDQVYSLELQSGFDPVLIARLMGYTDSRLQHSSILIDRGTRPRDSAKVLSKLGVAPETCWPKTRRNLNRRVPIGCRMKAHGGRGAKYAFLHSYGDGLIDEIIRTLKAGYPVAFGMPVDEAYTRLNGPHVLDRRPSMRDFIGNHYTQIVAVRIGSDGRPEFKIRNSYSPRWRDDGHIWLTSDVITSPFNRDFLVIYGTDRTINARPHISL